MSAASTELSAPLLSGDDVKAGLHKFYRGMREHHLFAFYGSGRSDVIELAGVGEISVVPVRSELELREQMPSLGDQEKRIAFLVPWTHDIPLDIAGRFALQGRVERIGLEARLKHFFQVSDLDEDVATSPLAEHLLKAPSTKGYSFGGGRLTADAMWRAWLAADWSVPTKGGLALDTFMAWAASDLRGPRFVDAFPPSDGAQPIAPIPQALQAYLRTRLGPTGVVLWSVWEQGKGRAALELAILFEALADAPQIEVKTWIKSTVMLELSVPEAEALEVANALGREVGGALRVIERDAGGAADVRALVAGAEARVTLSEVRRALVRSARLPIAWTQRLDELGAALSAGAKAPDAERLSKAHEALRVVQAHEFFLDSAHKQILQRSEMAVRLLAWLVARTDKLIVPSLTPQGDAEALGRWYSEEGGYIDWARRMARGSSDTDVMRGIQAVVYAADDVRTELDQRFAKSLQGWVEAGQPAHQVVPLHDAMRRVGAKFLDGNEERKLLVLLLDGMAWAQTVELLDSLGDRAVPWGPLAWHSTPDGRLGEGTYPVVFAGLPTVTEVSRSSFFAGKLFKAGARLDTAKDPERWADNPSVKKYSTGANAPRLLLRSEGHTKGGSASQEALHLVADQERRVVGMVLNAIDDSLKASHAVRHPWRVENIASLPDLLEKAREHERAVLLVSDHGHVPSDRIERMKKPHPSATVKAVTTGKGAGSRWRAWPSADSPVADNEVAFSGTKVYTPKGAHGVVLLNDDASAYAGNTHAGEHGGATLAEVVAPCLLIGCEDTGAPAFGGDAAQHVGAAYVPSWWYFEVRKPVVIPDEPARRKTARKKPVVDERQLGLAIAAEPKPAAPKTKIAPASVAKSAFGASKVLKVRIPDANERAVIVKAVDALLGREGVMSAAAFATENGVMKFRIGGFVSRLQEALNLDGYQVIRMDTTARLVHLDEGKLVQLFEVGK